MPDFAQLTSDVRVRLFALVATVALFIAGLKRRILDRVVGSVDDALDGFKAATERLEKARMAAIRRATATDAVIVRREAELDALEEQYELHLQSAERAARVQERLNKLLA